MRVRLNFMKSLGISLIFLLLLSLIYCSNQGENGSQSGHNNSIDSTQTQLDQDQRDAILQTELQVLSEGTGEKKILSYSFSENDEMIIRTENNVEVLAQNIRIITEYLVKIASVEDAQAEIDITLTSSSVDSIFYTREEMVEEETPTPFAKLVISDKGEISDQTILKELFDKSKEELARWVKNLTLTYPNFPEVPIGQGARWTVPYSREIATISGDFTLVGLMEFELKSLTETQDDTKVELEYSSQISFRSDSENTYINGDLTGSSVVYLKHPLNNSAQTEVQLNLVLEGREVSTYIRTLTNPKTESF